MKKIILIFLLFILCNTVKVNAFTYRQGVVHTSASVYLTPNASNDNRLHNDTGGIIVLYAPEVFEIKETVGEFYKIEFIYSGFFYTGYINKSNVKETVYETDENYERELINKGFPSDYARKLTILHSIHPNWTFTPSFTGKEEGGMDFQTVVNGESEVIARNLINSSNTSLRSTSDGAYNNGNWVSLSGSGWYAASKQTIAFFLDPRNFLDEEHIFMFENLGYNAETQTKEAVGRILSSTFMNNPFDCYEGANFCEIGSHTFVDVFIQAGIDKQISPVHLATRVVQEQGSSGSVLSLGLGYNDEYKGFYNFFNIGASGITDYDVIMNGLKYASNRNWNNQYVSIYEGSSFLSSNYISRGQSTLYYQKFNTITPSYYGNQYMQNVKAPYTESYSTYVGYYNFYKDKEEWNNAHYEFLIPIYKNMFETTLAITKNEDTTLKNLDISNCNLNMDFNSNIKDYECHTSKDTEKININAEATNELANVETQKEVILTEDKTEVDIKVTAADGSTTNYNITVIKDEEDTTSPSEILNEIGLKVNNAIVYNLELNRDISDIISVIKNKHHNADIKAISKDTEITSGKVKTGDKIIVTNGGKNNEYNLVVYGDTTGDGEIDIRDLLVIQKHLLNALNLTDAYLESADINKDGEVDIRDLLIEQKYLLGKYTINQD